MELVKDFSFQNVVCRTADFGIDVTLSGAGRIYYSSGVDDGAAFDAAFNDTFERALKYYGEYGVPYFVLPHDPASLTALLSAMLLEKYPNVDIDLKTVYLTELCPDEDSVRRMIAVKRGEADGKEDQHGTF